MRRSELREHIFKLLFLTDFHPENEREEQVALYLEELPELSEQDDEYIRTKYGRILEKKQEIDEKLDAVSEGWKTSRMSRVDLMLLRLAYFELRFDEDVPVGVAINEAVELAKRFGGEESGAFVNGLLGRVARDLEAEKKPDPEAGSAQP